MQIHTGFSQFPGSELHPVLTIGNFDGFHLGHRSLVNQLQSLAALKQTSTCVLTFEPPPRRVLSPNLCKPRIVHWPDKLRLLQEAGVEHVILQRFSNAFAQHTATWFVEEIILQCVQPAAMVVGYDFRFGRARGGDVNVLRNLAPKLHVEQVAPLEKEGTIVSSSWVRELVQNGLVAQASLILGRPHLVRGVVIPGAQRGRKIGFPTANLTVDTELIPASGVYAVYANIDNGPTLNGVANLGIQPTFNGHVFQFEVHLLDFDHDIYGTEIAVHFVQRLRPERRFSSSNDLVAQLHNDISSARKLLSD